MTGIVEKPSAPKAPLVGPAVNRVDGRSKVTGEAQYPSDASPRRLAYGCIVRSTISAGRVARIDGIRNKKGDGGVTMRTMLGVWAGLWAAAVCAAPWHGPRLCLQRRRHDP